MSRVQSIERAFAVLAALTDGPVGVTDVAERADLPKSTAARMLASLAARAPSSRCRATPATGSVRGSRRSPTASARPTASSRWPGRISPSWPRPSARRPVCRCRMDVVHYIDQVDDPTPSGSATGPAPASRCTRSRSGLVFLANVPPVSLDAYLARSSRRSRPGRSRSPMRCASGCSRPRRRLRLGPRGVRRGPQLRSGRGRRLVGERDRGRPRPRPAYRFPEPGGEQAIGTVVVAAATRVSERLRRSTDRFGRA